MSYRIALILPILLMLAGCQADNRGQQVSAQDDGTTAAFRLLTKSSHWQLTAAIEMDFPTFHTQGLVKIGDIFYVSAVEIIEKTETYARTDNLWDFSLTRTAGKGRGWLFKFDGEGRMLGKVELTRGDAFHPGGMDFDGRYIWVPVAEYRPNSASNIYRVDPVTMEAELSFRVKDHIGNILHNTARDTFHGSSWGARRMYEWHVRFDHSGQGVITREKWSPNPVHYIDYQDCQYSGVNYMFCGGLQKYDTPLGKVALGGIDLIDISGDQPVPVHMLPIAQYWDGGDDAKVASSHPADAELVVSNNPFWVEEIADRPVTEAGTKIMRIYFMPDKDNRSRLLIYDVAVPFLPDSG
ncbi:MAG: hypothetical protein COB49_06095 [Alphaproteobacteria bacterium]|nr:MAG: hypothetical protein COB49_06095 [Alphaproteobacteria bacterium]